MPIVILLPTIALVYFCYVVFGILASQSLIGGVIAWAFVFLMTISATLFFLILTIAVAVFD